MAIKHTDVLAAMADKYNEQTAQLIDIAIAVVLLKMGERSITFSAAEMVDFVKKHRVVRELTEPNAGGPLAWTVRVDPDPEATSPS